MTDTTTPALPPFARQEQIIDDYLANYEFRGDEGDYAPKEHERFLMKDAIMGLLVDDDWIALEKERIEQAVLEALAQQAPLDRKYTHSELIEHGERERAVGYREAAELRVAAQPSQSAVELAQECKRLANEVASAPNLHDFRLLVEGIDRLASLAQPAPAGDVLTDEQIKRMREALERIADPRNTHFAGDAQVVARAALTQEGSTK